MDPHLQSVAPGYRVIPAAPQCAAGFDILNSERTGALSKRFFYVRNKVYGGLCMGSSERCPSEQYVNLHGLPPLFDVDGGSSQLIRGQHYV